MILGFVSFLLKWDLKNLWIVQGHTRIQEAISLRERPKGFLGLFTAFAWVYLLLNFLLLPLIRHWSFGTWFWDLAAMEQVLWRSSHGFGITSTAILNDPLTPLDFVFKQHLNLWLYPTSFFYRIFPFTESLLIAQSLALLLALIPLWKIGGEIFGTKIPVILLPLFYWCWQAVHKVNVWDVHENAFIPVFSLWAYYFFLKKRWWLTFAFTLAVAFVKEDAWVLAGAMGFYFLGSKKKWFWAAGCVVLGFAVFASYGVYFNKVITLGERYGYLGNDFSQSLNAIKSNPFIFFQQLCLPEPRYFLWRLFLLGGGTWLLSGLALIPIIPTFLECALSTNHGMQSFNNHYAITLAGPLFFAIACGLKKIENHKKLLVGVTLISIAQLYFSETNTMASILGSDAWKNRKCMASLVEKIPETDAVYAQNPLASHLSKREILLLYKPGTSLTLDRAWIAAPEDVEIPASFLVIAQDCGCKLARNF